MTDDDDVCKLQIQPSGGGSVALWATVLVQMYRDLTYTGSDKDAVAHRDEAKAYLTVGSADLQMVCDCAGVDVDAIKRYARWALAHPREARQWLSRGQMEVSDTHRASISASVTASRKRRNGKS